jgi:hypothetical protein
MGIASAFGTTVLTEQPTSGYLSSGQVSPDGTKTVSDFVTVQSLTNFSAMTGVITTVWGALQATTHFFDSRWVPFTLCLIFGVASFISSGIDGNIRKWFPALFIALINSLALFGAILGTATLAPGAN